MSSALVSILAGSRVPPQSALRPGCSRAVAVISHRSAPLHLSCQVIGLELGCVTSWFCLYKMLDLRDFLLFKKDSFYF